MKRYTQNTLVGILLAGAAFTLSVDVAAARGMGGAGGPHGMMGAAFAELDSNGDGGVTLAEIQAHGSAKGAERFAKADLDASGALDAVEVQTMISEGIKMIMETRAARAEDSEHARPGGFFGGFGSDVPQEARLAWMAQGLMLRFDANGDALITAEELKPVEGRIEHFFERVDTDGDSTISEAEYDVAKSWRGGRRGGHGRP